MAETPQDRRRREFVALLGQYPPRTDTPHVAILSEVSADEHIRRLIEYRVLDGETVRALVLIPKGATGRVPGVLAIHQDGSHRPYEFGKGEPAGVCGNPELAYGAELCKRGYVVICPDRFPFEDRQLSLSRFREVFAAFPVYTDDEGSRSDLTEDLYRGCVSNYALVQGQCCLGRELHECQTALDILSHLPEVDGDRIGAIGHSAGGLLAALLMYVDDRVSVGCSSCGLFMVTDMYDKDKLRPINGFGLLWPPGIRLWGDVDDVLAGLAPRPFMETASDYDGTSVQEIHAKAVAKYAELGIADRFKVIEYGTFQHEFRADMRRLSYEWIDKWIGPDRST